MKKIIKKLLLLNIVLIFIIPLGIDNTFAERNLETIYYGGPNKGTDCRGGGIASRATRIVGPNEGIGSAGCSRIHHYYESYYFKNVTKYNNVSCNTNDKVVGHSRYKIKCQRHDDTPPNRPIVKDKYLANDNLVFTVTDSGGSGYYKTIANSGSIPVQTNNNGFSIDISNLNGAINGEKKFLIDFNIYDKAGNYIRLRKNIAVYADSGHIGSFEVRNKSIFTDPNNIADGDEKKLQIILRDKYSNCIIPASGIHRKIDFQFEVYNNLKINQYRKIGEAVFLKTSKSNNYESITNNKEFTDERSTNGIYDFTFKIYAPTNNENKFIIKKIKVDIKGDNGFARTNIQLHNSYIHFNFKPLYITEFSGEQKDDGFITNIYQEDGLLKISKNSTKSINNGKIFLKKSKDDSNKFTWKCNIGGQLKDFGNKGTLNKFSINLDRQRQNFKTFFEYANLGDTLGDISELIIISYIQYEIDNKTIIYAGDKIGGKRNSGNNGLKVMGISHIDKSKYRVINTEKDNIRKIKGTINKAGFKAYIRSNIYRIIKSINTDESGKEVNGIIYYDFKNSPNGIKEIKISELNTNKTIIVKGGNVYIICDGNRCSTDGNHFPGIIVLKDDNKKGGKLYIDPKVSRIDAAMYIEKSIMNYKNGEITDENSSLLKNQLYIKGTVVSENTIGGSIKEETACPLYTYEKTGFVCSRGEARKYDLHFLRRGILDENGIKISNVERQFPVIIEYNSKMQLNPPKLFYK